MNTNTIHTGDAFEVLEELPSNSVHMAMTSPPYWNLRDYGHEDQLGLEPEPEAYIQNIADVMDGVKRVLRDDGSLWLNLGDTYDDKDLQLIPERVALELQNRGWILRNKATWVKPNPMPNSVTDRLNTVTEKVFHLVKNKSYWYDLDAIREPYKEASKERMEYDYDPDIDAAKHTDNPSVNNGGEIDPNPAGKNPGDVFEITTKPFPEAHFAVYPPQLCEKPIKATCPPKVCSCGTPYERDIEREEKGDNLGKRNDPRVHDNTESNLAQAPSDWEPPEVEDNGWGQTCNCDTEQTNSGIVLDPFAGAGTTLLKAKDLNRQFVGIELNPEYADMARARVGLTPNDPSTIRESENQTGLEKY